MHQHNVALPGREDLKRLADDVENLPVLPDRGSQSWRRRGNRPRLRRSAAEPFLCHVDGDAAQPALEPPRLAQPRQAEECAE